MAGAVDSGIGELYIRESVADTKTTGYFHGLGMGVDQTTITWCFRAQALDSRWGFDSPPVL